MSFVSANIPTPRKPPKTRSAVLITPKGEPPVDAKTPADEGPATKHDHPYMYRCKCSPDCACHGCEEKDARIKDILHRFEELKVEGKVNPVESSKEDSVCDKYIKSDEKVNTYTGLPSVKALEDLVGLVTPFATNMQYWRGSHSHIARQEPQNTKSGPARKLTIKEELVMTLMKLRLGLINDLLGDIFGVSSSTVSQIFNTYIRMLSKLLKPLIFWPSKEKIQDHLPKDLHNYPNLRVTIDCTEVFIDRPRHLELQAQTWSDYKKHNTVKVLVGIAPNGAITFLSKAWGGRTSDKKITSECGFLECLDPGDLVMADRGFPIQEDLLIRGAKLLIPPPSSGKDQQTRGEV